MSYALNSINNIFYIVEKFMEKENEVIFFTLLTPEGKKQLSFSQLLKELNILFLFSKKSDEHEVENAVNIFINTLEIMEGIKIALKENMFLDPKIADIFSSKKEILLNSKEYVDLNKLVE